MSKLIVKTDDQLLNAIQTSTNCKGQSFASITATTEPKLTKKHRDSKIPFTGLFKGNVFKTSVIPCNINVKYENAVNNQLNREGKTQLSFSGQSLPYGQWVKGLENIVIEHKEQYQLRYFEGMTTQKSKTVYHYEDGTELTEHEKFMLQGFLPKKSKAMNQGTEKEIKPRNVKFAGITKLKLNGITIERI